MSATLGPGISYGRAARFQYSATAAQSTFVGADQNGLTMRYTPGFVEVVVNGEWYPPSDYTATDGSSVVLPTPAVAGDVIYVYALSMYSSGDSVSFLSAQALTSGQKTQAQQNIFGGSAFAALLRGYLNGLTLSTAGASTTFGIAAGVANDSTFTDLMLLASAYTKTTSAWAVGTGNGAMDTGAVAASTWYHVHLIKRPDTGVVDVLFSLSATAPTLPANYTLFRRIGAMRTNGSSQWILFHQLGDEFLWDVRVVDANAVIPGVTTAVLLALTVPTNIQIAALYTALFIDTTGGTSLVLSSPDESDQAGSGTCLDILNPTGSANIAGNITTRTNTSAQIRVRGNTTTYHYSIFTRGWLDTRGKLS